MSALPLRTARTSSLALGTVRLSGDPLATRRTSSLALASVRKAPAAQASSVVLGTFEAAEGWIAALADTTYFHGGVQSRRLSLGGNEATQRTFDPVVNVSGTTTLKVWTMLRNGSPGLWSANLIATMYDDLLNQRVISFPLAFNYQDGLEVWIERSAAVDWSPLDPARFWRVIFSLQAISFGGGLGYIDDFTATGTSTPDKTILTTRRTSSLALATVRP